jgi:hypothetical protein
MDLTERFMEKVFPVPEAGCWIWDGPLNNKGYGKLYGKPYGQSTRYAHRISYGLFKGPIADGLCVLHRCDVACCVNPDHLFLGTILDNNRDMIEKGRYKGYYGSARTETHCKNGHELTYRKDASRSAPRRFCKVCNSKYGKRSADGNRH